MRLVFLITVFLRTSLGQEFRAYIFEEDHTAVEGALCTIFRDGSDPVEKTLSDGFGICNFTEEIVGGEDGDIIMVRDLLPSELDLGYPTANAPHAKIRLKIWDELEPLLVPFLPIPQPGEIIIFLSWTGASFFESDLSGEELDLDLHLFIESDSFNCSHISSKANRVCHGTNAQYCNGVARMEKDDGAGTDSILTTALMGLEIMRIVDTNPGRYRFQAYALDLGHVTFQLNDADVIYLGMVFGSRIAFGGKGETSAEVVPQSIMSYFPETALVDGSLRWWHAFTIDVFEPGDTTINCQRTVDIWKVNHFCNDCAPENLLDNTALAVSPDGELVKAKHWADCLWAITQSSCAGYIPATFEREAFARSYGDPHFITNDGLKFDIFTHGTYNYLKSSEKEVDIQARLVYLSPNFLTYNGQVVIEVEQNTFEFAARFDGALIAQKDGKENYFATQGTQTFGSGDKHKVQVITWFNGETSYFFNLYGGDMKITVSTITLPNNGKREFDLRGVTTGGGFLSLTTGALGDFNNVQNDDFVKNGHDYLHDKDDDGGLNDWGQQWAVKTNSGFLPYLLEETDSLFSPYLDWLVSLDPDLYTKPPPPVISPALAAEAAAACASLYDAATRLFEYNSCVFDASIPGGPDYVLSNPTYRTCTDHCNHNGICLPGDECFCTPSFTGRWCDTAVCVCLNGGTCLPTGFCSCAAGWTGYNCERAPDCSNLEDCNDDACIEDNICECSDGVTGPSCGVSYTKADHCLIQQNPFDNNMTCFGSCNDQQICGNLPDDRYSCYCMDDLTQTDPGHCSSDVDCAASAISPEFVMCDFQHCYCKNRANSCTDLDCSSCSGCISATDCVGNPVLVECLENKCRCMYDGMCIENSCTECKHQIDITMTPRGRSVVDGLWTVSSRDTPEVEDGFPPVLLQENSFEDTVDMPADSTALEISEALVAALQLNSDFTSFCDTELTGSEWNLRCSPLEGSVVLDFNGVDTQLLQDYEYNGINIKTTGFCVHRYDCLGAPVELVGCMDNQCVCIFGEDTCTHTDCSECKGCVTGHVDCSFEKGPSVCVDGECSCTIDGTCIDIDCSKCVHPPYDPPTDYWCGVDGEFGTFKGRLLNNYYDVEDYIDCCLQCRANRKCDAFSFDGIPPKVCKFYDVGAKPLIRPGYMKGWHHGKLRHPDP